MKVDGHQIDLSKRDKMFFPDAGLSKGDLIDYYEKVADIMVPHMQHYGVSMERFPDGVQGDSFFNKDTPDYFPDWITRVAIEKREGGQFHAPVVDSAAALIYLANQAVITPHLYLARTDDLEHPDKLVFDLDPPSTGDPAAALRQASLRVRELMAEVDMQTWIQTSGANGFHLIVPLDRSADFEQVREFAKDCARVLVNRHPDDYTLEQRKDKRDGKIFLDMLRNAYGATSVAPYAVRAQPTASVATPIEWQELEDGAGPQSWTIETIPRRLAQKNDPWQGMMRHSYKLGSHEQKLRELLAAEGVNDD
ncbi:non-homologous end-joining DNA ligase [Pseudidiomarina sp. 1APP75-27a]|uniref:non-homologous end-joining DNA ligase n=1 Tax=Pseudidiomarina terrestris TaxID=2820060 RepID=UPI00264C4891|nr:MULTISPECIES: non-homologous end-joining DNA ligase [unclassified Pseudidiomarina]MDN7137223.1 non-homologous end-joining DNA ligase [Pseudidiomarina sp. 1ASP75-14]MEA3588519.1 non-homologous end-joining DNA ligase [Pseudidiomarina sp. 1APP75-27a]